MKALKFGLSRQLLRHQSLYDHQLKLMMEQLPQHPDICRQLLGKELFALATNYTVDADTDKRIDTNMGSSTTPSVAFRNTAAQVSDEARRHGLSRAIGSYTPMRRGGADDDEVVMDGDDEDDSVWGEEGGGPADGKIVEAVELKINPDGTFDVRHRSLRLDDLLPAYDGVDGIAEGEIIGLAGAIPEEGEEGTKRQKQQQQQRPPLVAGPPPPPPQSAMPSDNVDVAADILSASRRMDRDFVERKNRTQQQVEQTKKPSSSSSASSSSFLKLLPLKELLRHPNGTLGMGIQGLNVLNNMKRKLDMTTHKKTTDVEYKFEVGDVVRHRSFGHVGVVSARFPFCLETDEWIEENLGSINDERMAHPWYFILVARSDGLPGDFIRYGSQLSHEKISVPQSIGFHCYLSYFFKGYDPVRGRYIPLGEADSEEDESSGAVGAASSSTGSKSLSDKERRAKKGKGSEATGEETEEETSGDDDEQAAKKGTTKTVKPKSGRSKKLRENLFNASMETRT